MIPALQINSPEIYKKNVFFKTIRKILLQKRLISLAKNKSIESVKGLEKNKSDELAESIIYAKRIQEGMMLKEKHLYRLFPESFLLFKPKDTVSGDFYWFTKIENKIIIAVADCTGHGIPGAFMSVLGISLLNQIIIEEKNTNVDLILQRLNHKLNKAFSYSSDNYGDERKLYDGMDIALCCVNNDSQQITYSGALRPLFHLSENQLVQVDGSRYPIGGLNLEKDRGYESKSLTFKKGDKLYLFTDGYADQFGGYKNKKFMIRNFKNLLLEIGTLPMKNQKFELDRVLNQWKEGVEQTDDILIIGVEL